MENRNYVLNRKNNFILALRIKKVERNKTFFQDIKELNEALSVGFNFNIEKVNIAIAYWKKFFKTKNNFQPFKPTTIRIESLEPSLKIAAFDENTIAHYEMLKQAEN